MECSSFAQINSYEGANSLFRFLWVHFQLVELCTAVTPSQIRVALQGLPNGLGDTYERILTRINNTNLQWNIAKRIFQWLACARRPLKLEEMQEAVAFEYTDKAWDADKIPSRNSLLKICQGLVVQAPDNGIVQFAHYTVQQYLFNNKISGVKSRNTHENQDATHHHCLSIKEAQEDANDLCFTYLNFRDFETAIIPQVQDTRFAQHSIFGPGGPGAIAGSIGLGKPVFNAIYRVIGRSTRPAALDVDYAKYLNLQQKPVNVPQDGKHEFLEYIIENWPWHIEHPSKIPLYRYENLLIKKSLPFEFRPWGPNRHFGPYGCNFCSTPPPYEQQPKELILAPMIHWAAAEGNHQLLAYVDIFDNRTALGRHLRHEAYSKETITLASRMGHTNVVGFLLRRHNFLCWDPSLFMVAASAGHVETLELLRQKHQEEFDTHVDGLLFKAATNGHASMVRYLLKDIVSVEIRDDLTEMTPLQSAFAHGHEEVIRALAEGGTIVDQQDSSGATALHQAVRHGDLSMTKCLVECGAGIGCKDWQNQMPLDLAILAGHMAIAEYLLADSF